MDGLKSGQVASAAGVTVETLRYYERRGILAEPARRDSGYRVYPAEAVAVVRFIKRAQQLGFALDEIRELLGLRGSSGGCPEVRAAAVAKLAEIDAKIADLEAMKRALADLASSCAETDSPGPCPLLQSLDRSEPAS